MHPSIHSLPCTLLYVYTRIKTKPSISVLSILFDCINTVSDNKEFLRVIKQMATVLYSQVLNSNLKCYSVMNPVRIKIWLNLHNMMEEVMLNQDSILNFLKVPHILSISHLKCHSWISVYFFICKLIGWWRHNMTILQADWLVTS